MMEEYWLRFAFAAVAGGALAVLGARMVAHYIDQDPWVVRITGYCLLTLGIVGVGACWNLSAAIKILLVAVVVCPLLAWFDVVSERKETDMAAERMQRFLNKRRPRH